MRRRLILTSAILLAVVISGYSLRAQDAGGAAPNDLVDRLMTALGQGKVDDALAVADFPKDQTDARDLARQALLTFRDVQEHYTGYDIAAVQKITPRLQKFWVMAYTDVRPRLLRIDFYRPGAEAGSAWEFHGLGFEDINNSDVLKDVPIDYPGHSGQNPRTFRR